MRWIAIAGFVVVAGCGHNSDPFESTGDPNSGEPVRDAKPAVVIVDTEATAPNMQTTARVRVVPHAPFHLNDKYRFKLALEPTDGVELAKTTFAPADAEKFETDELVVPVAVTATARGELTIRGTLEVGVCSPRSCLTEHLPVSIQIRVAVKRRFANGTR